jgi:O-antigen/teichoic acid export membrane protein
MGSFQWPIAVAAQCLWSMASFLVTIYLVRLLTLHEFGLFTIVITIRTLILMMLSALALHPMIVISSRRIENQKKDPLLATVVFSFEVISTFLILSASFVNWFCEWPVFQFIIFMIGGLAVELQRRINYVHGRINQDFVGGLIVMAGSIGGLLVLTRLGLFTLGNIFLVLGLINLIWAVQSGWNYWLYTPTILKVDDLAEVWKIGRWGLGTNLVGYVFGQASTYWTLGLIGTAGVAILELGRQFVLPIQVLLVGTANIWQTKLVRSAAKKPSNHFVKEVWRVTCLQTGVGTLLLVTILALISFFIPWMIPGKEQAYAGSLTVAWILSGSMICQLLGQHPTFSLIVLGKPEYGFLTKVVAALFLIPVGYYMTREFGVTGAAWSRVLGEFLMFIMSVVMLNRAVNYREDRKVEFPNLIKEESHQID